MSDPRPAVAAYYSDKLATHGTTARGVDWNSEASQQLRFEQLLRVVDAEGPFSLLDWGCGYGALLDLVDRSLPGASYVGYDIAPTMVAAARSRHPRASFTAELSETLRADFTVASGIFSVRLDYDAEEWERHVIATLDEMARRSRRAMAFNMLTSYSDPDLMRNDLHYADPCMIFDHCKRNLSPNVALLHDYGLYEFTILVRLQLT